MCCTDRKTAPRGVRDILNEADKLSATLKDVERLLAGPIGAKLELSQNTRRGVADCLVHLRRLTAKVEEGTRYKRVVWPLKKGEMANIVQNMERCRAAISLDVTSPPPLVVIPAASKAAKPIVRDPAKPPCEVCQNLKDPKRRSIHIRVSSNVCQICATLWAGITAVIPAAHNIQSYRVLAKLKPDPRLGPLRVDVTDPSSLHSKTWRLQFYTAPGRLTAPPLSSETC